MDKNDILDRTRLQQAGKAITDMIKECKIDLEEARKEEHSNMSNEQIEAYCEIGHSYVKELKEEYLKLEKEMKNKEIMKRVARSMKQQDGGRKKKGRKSRKRRRKRNK
tara:strand:+ start:8193 stop:8516 length:324 start_codon:yes stop_codon:yes gene_type:complete